MDTKNIFQSLRDAVVAPDVTRQISYADRILLNKIDLVTAEEVSVQAVLALLLFVENFCPIFVIDVLLLKLILFFFVINI